MESARSGRPEGGREEGRGRGGGPTGTLRSQAACAENRKAGKAKRRPAQTSATSRTEPESLGRLSCSPEAAVAGSVGTVYRLGTDAKLVSGGGGTGSLTVLFMQVFLYVFRYFFPPRGQKGILFQHSVVFYTETV